MYGRRWKWGINTYATMAEATARLAELTAVGIKARIRMNSDLMN